MNKNCLYCGWAIEDTDVKLRCSNHASPYFDTEVEDTQHCLNILPMEEQSIKYERR